MEFAYIFIYRSDVVVDKIIGIIQNEDKKNPLTDEKIALMLKVSRKDVTEYRLIKKIPDSRERRRPYLYKDIEEVLNTKGNISDRKLTKILNDSGYDISRFTVSQVRKHVMNKVDNSRENRDTEAADNVYLNNEAENTEVANNVYLNNDAKSAEVVDNLYLKNNADNKEIMKDNVYLQRDDISSFKEIIGHDGSLSMQINQAKAAILYPPHGLHTLILGPSGVGKSQLAEAMHKYAMESTNFAKDSPFIVFNCADYADNPQLLMAQLFGYNKGSFTGANTSRAGLVEKADGGILFLDEVHRLPSEGQEILFSLLDKGSFRRLGETENTRNATIMLIAATTENPESSLLLTFRRRIPMVIELTPINERPFTERYQIIKNFFTEESFRIKRPIKIDLDALRALMLYDCPGNIGQIRSDIQVACARGLLNTLNNKGNNINIYLTNLPSHIRRGIPTVNTRDPEIEKYADKDMMVYPDKRVNSFPKGDRYMLPNQIYQFIEDRFNELKNHGLSKDDIYEIVGSEVENELKKFVNDVKSSTLASKKDLKEIVGEKILYAVENALEIAKQNYKYIRPNFLYSLAIHISAAYDRIKCGKSIINPQLKSIKRKYVNEFKIARQMVERINKDLEIALTDDEVGFIAMYLKIFSTSEDNSKKRVAVIVLTHGHVAKGMAEVANKLLGVNIAHGIEMDLDERPEDALLRTIALVKELDEGKGCVILIDMGSLITFGEIITKRTGIPTRTIGRVDTVMVLEAVRRAIVPDTTIDDVVNALDSSKSYVGHVEGAKDSYKLPKAVVTICITGEGTAVKIKKYIEDKIHGIEKKFKIIPIGVFNEHEIDEQITNIRYKNIIAAFVGTIDPKVNGIPFIPVEEIMSGEGLDKLGKLIGMDVEEKNRLEKVITEDLILNNLNVNNKNDAIDKIIKLMEGNKCVKEGFMLSVYKRESIGATWLEGGIAIPHGSTKYVNKSTIAIAKLKRPIYWEDNMKADLIFMIAIREDSKDYMYDLYKVLKNKNIMNALRTAENSREMKEIILKSTI